MKMGKVFSIVKQAALDWMADHASRLGAALAFYTIFSLAPLLTIVVSVASLWFSENANQEVMAELASVVGQDNAKSLEGMLVQPENKGSGIFTTISATLMLFVGATAVFVQLQDSLNAIWEVKPKPGQGIMGFVRHRLLSFAMVLGIAFLLLVSLLLTTAISAMGKYFSGMFGDATILIQVVNTLVTFGLITLLFALMFKYVPDAEVAWKDVWVGAVVTAVLFTIGKFFLGWYLGRSSVVSTYAAAGALLVVLLWVYYASQILFFGAEITQAYARSMGRAVQPSEHAEWDEAKKAESEQSEHERDRKREMKERRKQGMKEPADPNFHPRPAPSYAMASTAAAGQGVRTKRSWASRLLMLAVMLPIEKRITRKSKV